MSEERERLVAEIPSELKALVDADERTNREIVEAALVTEFGGEKKAAIERRIEQRKQRISLLESEKNERSREIEEEEEEIERLRAKKNAAVDAKQTIVEQAVEDFSHVPDSPTNPAIKPYAEKADMDPETFYAKLQEEMNNA